MSTNISQSSENQSLTQRKIERLQLSVRKGWTPPPRISVPQWADDYRKLAKEAGSTSGNWETSTVEIARGPMLAATESGVHIITVMCCTQLMKTALLENLFGYFAHLDPCPILLLQPKEEAAEQFSKERISPMVRVTPVLRNIIGDSKQKSSKETILYKAFTGGFLALAGAGSPDNLARRPIRVLLADEVDKYPITREGDPIALAEERTATFGLNWLSVRACSPTVEDETRNNQHESLLGVYRSPSPRYIWAAALTGAAAPSLRNDPGRPLQSLPVYGVLAPDLADRFELTERNNLLYSGISTYTVGDDGTVMIENLITTYQKNSYGDEDDSYLQVETLFSLMFVTRYLRTAVTSKFGRMKLAADGTRFAPGAAIVTPNIIRADQIAEYQTLVFNGYAQDAEAFARNIIVEQNKTNPNRVDVLWPGTLMNQLRIFALLNQFRLQAESTGA